ncbi:hypothetical protein BG61_35350 [Caballeronia glathei]|uniref:Uncharacterized protein n=1 Tax=Caballeronia glathei TaxID=60547 RepID=A0A069PE78_9BURK|nr:hypothetical protein BG61_35350 [Caballeronia glathei]
MDNMMRDEADKYLSKLIPSGNLASRRRAYWWSVSYWVAAGLILASVCLGAVSYFGTSWVFAGVVSATVMAGFLSVTWPDYPTAEDVERDRGFRRSQGLPGESNDARH